MVRVDTQPYEEPFDFDEWARLASSNPETFEDRRRELLHSAIADAPPERQRRLEALQWRLDQVRRQARNPMAASLAMYSMMWDAVLGENGLRDSLLRVTPQHWADGPPPEPRSAEVIPFRRRDHRRT